MSIYNAIMGVDPAAKAVVMAVGLSLGLNTPGEMPRLRDAWFLFDDPENIKMEVLTRTGDASFDEDNAIMRGGDLYISDRTWDVDETYRIFTYETKGSPIEELSKRSLIAARDAGYVNPLQQFVDRLSMVSPEKAVAADEINEGSTGDQVIVRLAADLVEAGFPGKEDWLVVWLDSVHADLAPKRPWDLLKSGQASYLRVKELLLQDVKDAD